jgi:UPF0176 protein
MKTPLLHNRKSKEECIAEIQKETFKRRTVSFYRYVNIKNPKKMRDTLYQEWDQMNIRGRIYVAHEGINAQINVPEPEWENFIKNLESRKEFKNMPLKIAVEDFDSFYKLTIKTKKKIVSDGLDDGSFDTTNVGRHLTAEEFNQAIEDPHTVVVDMRNHYESEIGHFEKAICPDADTFREELPIVTKTLEDKKDKKVLLYCTGGVRCEKASAYLRHQGFHDVNQLHGGIIDYFHQCREKKLPIKFKGKNFVFDERMGERITNDIVSHCHQCKKPCDTHTNCKNDACHLLFIQCEECKQKFENCCTHECQKIAKLPQEEQKKRRKNQDSGLSVYKSRLRPKLYEGKRLEQKYTV